MIDFTFTEEQEMFRKMAREFAENMVAPHVAEMEETGEANDDVIRALAEAEMMAITIPEEYGGLGLGYTARMIAVEEISRVSVATARARMTSSLTSPVSSIFATWGATMFSANSRAIFLNISCSSVNVKSIILTILLLLFL